jgi:hypothetical protein
MLKGTQQATQLKPQVKPVGADPASPPKSYRENYKATVRRKLFNAFFWPYLHQRLEAKRRGRAKVLAENSVRASQKYLKFQHQPMCVN